jgi:hypothetical protein
MPPDDDLPFSVGTPREILGEFLAALIFMREVAATQHGRALELDDDLCASAWQGIALSLTSTLMAGIDMGESGADDA